ncbi:MAG: type III-A CRISPR-associated RAMP protein Csm3 [Cyclobacteriaceae bacterium]
MKLKKKIKISGFIKTITGLHIGGSKSSLDIGGIDNSVIKTINGIPYIPGSSIKGKLRGLLAKSLGSKALRKRDLKEDKDNSKEKNGIKTDDDFKILKKLFGPAEDQSIEFSRLIVRDAYLVTENTDGVTVREEFIKLYKAADYTEEKTENVINRLKGTGEDPRNIERVPTGSYFEFNMVLDVYDEGEKNTANDENELITNLKAALSLMQDDYLGGSGTRGYGQIEFEGMKMQENIVDEGKYVQGEKCDFIINDTNSK